MAPPDSTSAVVEQLHQQQQLDTHSYQQINDYLSHHAIHETPWLHSGIRLIQILSAWFAFFLFFSALYLTKLVDENNSLIFGLCLISAAIMLAYLAKKSFFLQQLALAWSLTGQVLCLFGVSTYDNSLASLAMADMFIAGVIFIFYPHAAQRMIACLSFFIASFLLLHHYHLFLFKHILLFTLTSSYALLWLNESRLQAYAAYIYPFTAAVCLILQALILLNLLPFTLIGLDSFYTACFLFLTVCTIVWAIIRPLNLSVIAIMLLVMTLGLFAYVGTHVPALLAALLIILISYQRGQMGWLNFGIVGFLAALFLYYYTLELDLLSKSMLLMGIGGSLLLGRAMLNFHNKHNE